VAGAAAAVMKVVRQAGELPTNGRKVCLAIGVFDGVHLGHQQVIRQAIADARQHEAIAVALTFDRHPSSVVAPERARALIYSLPQKLRAIESMGVDATLLIEFTETFSRKTGEEFVRELASGFGGVHSICVGAAFTFGHKRSGNVDLLRELGWDLKFMVHGLSALALDGETVSSTRIRQCIREGDLDAATQMLGRSYGIAGKVIEGDRVGRTLNAPTANVDVAGLVLPPDGVYAVHAEVKGRCYRGVANLGLRPTLRNPQPQQRFEVHLLDFAGDIYGQEIEVTFVDILRSEKKFDSLEDLKMQIAKDIEFARRIFES
jgi:riboflavin kinase / FMN adenylyltransferase